VLNGYRGFLHELARTGTWRALSLQVRTGAGHVVRRLLRRGDGDPIARFLANYGADGFRLADPARARIQLAAEACLACGLCSVECARAGGAPPFEPRDAVLSAVRLEIDWLRLEPLAPRVFTDVGPASACGACTACEAVCPVAIPIAAVQATLVQLGAAGSVATPARIR
jgi:ferredoxin